MTAAPAVNPTVPVSQRALVQRLNRALAPGEMIRGTRGRHSPRPWYRVDLVANTALTVSIQDIEREARHLGVLKPHERLA